MQGSTKWLIVFNRLIPLLDILLAYMLQPSRSRYKDLIPHELWLTGNEFSQTISIWMLLTGLFSLNSMRFASKSRGKISLKND